MKVSDVKDVIMIAAVIAAVVVIYRAYKKATEPGGFIDNVLASPIATAFTTATLPGAVEVTGYAVLPNGNRVPMSGLYVGTDLTFDYLGKRYKVTARKGNEYQTVAA